MVKTASTMVPLGTKASDFRLQDTQGRWRTLADFAPAPALLVAFLSNHCPYVQHVRNGLAQLARDWNKRKIAVVGINSNDVQAYPDDSPEQMKLEVTRAGYDFPYLFDADQSVAKAYRAACTPDFFLFDARRALFYRGQMDGARPGNDVPVTGADLAAALDALLAHKPPPAPQRPSLGCNIKWKPGREPEWFSK